MVGIMRSCWNKFNLMTKKLGISIMKIKIFLRRLMKTTLTLMTLQQMKVQAVNMKNLKMPTMPNQNQARQLQIILKTLPPFQ